MSLNRVRLAALALNVSICLAGPALAATKGDAIPPEPGDRWKVTQSMSAMGMSMPPRTTEFCAPRSDANSPPVPVDDKCQISDLKRSASKVSFNMRCVSPKGDTMDGRMEMEYLGTDHYKGKMTMFSKDGNMEMNMEGQKLPGECDAAEMKRKIAKIQGDAAAMTAKMCAENAKTAEPSFFIGPDAMCKDPKDKAAFCANVQAHKGFLSLSQRQRIGAQSGDARSRDALAQTAAACGFKPDAVRSTLCGSAEGKSQWAFLAVECPSIADPLAKRECAGRNYTNPVAQKYVDFCSAYASNGRGEHPGFDGESDSGGNASNGGGKGGGRSGANGDSRSAGNGGQSGNTPPAEQPEQKPSAGDAVKGVLKGVDKLRGIFGR